MLLAHPARSFVLLPLAVTLLSGCPRAVDVVADTGIASQDSDAATAVGGDAASTVGDAAAHECTAELLADAGLTQGPGVAASIGSPQFGGWDTASIDPECAAIEPGAVPTPLSWTGPLAATTISPWCDPAVADGEGNLVVPSLSGPVAGNTFLRGDGNDAKFNADGNNALQLLVAPRGSGFVVLPIMFKPWCEFAELLDPDARAGSAIVVESVETAQIWALVANPLGGYVQARKLIGQPTQQEYSLQLRWVNDSLQPLGDWHTATTWPLGTENSWRVVVDQKGSALVLSFVFPPSLGAPPPPSMWTFSARWMDATGPLTEPFQPIVPTYTSPNGTVYFADWNTIRPLRNGGFAMFHPPAPQGSGTVSPVGWYAFYPSGAAVTGPAPAWLQSYDGTLQLLAGGAAYAALQHDPSTCARTVQVIAPSGRTCFTLALEGSNLCGFRDAIWPDGTLVLQGGCLIRWWPGLARVAQ